MKLSKQMSIGAKHAPLTTQSVCLGKKYGYFFSEISEKEESKSYIFSSALERRHNSIFFPSALEINLNFSLKKCISKCRLQNGGHFGPTMRYFNFLRRRNIFILKITRWLVSIRGYFTKLIYNFKHSHNALCRTKFLFHVKNISN